MDEKVIPIKTSSFNDLVRLAASTMIPHQLTTYMIKFKHKDKIVIGLLGVFRDYYKYYGIPVFYYYTFDSNDIAVIEANYVILHTDRDGFELSKNPKPGITIPLINLAERPMFIPDDIC
ncbi:MAG: hypothetical protein QXP02_06060 [Desulfurococcaceae archaeon]